MKRIEHREAKWPFPFVEYAPEQDSAKLPLIIQLHGAGERGDGGACLDAVDVHGFTETIADKEIPCRFIMPQCPNGSFWAAWVESLERFVRQLIEEYDADADRVYMTGLSMGGFGTWFTAMAHPTLFAAIAPVCGGGMAWNAGVLTMPVWAFHGAEDDVVSVAHSDMMVEGLRSCGANVTYTRLDGVKHNAWDYAYTEELLHWLLAQHK